MAVNVDMLKEKIAKSGITVKEIVSHLEMDESTYYRKISNNGNAFTVAQIQKLVDLLKLNKTDACNIFLKENSRIRKK